MQTLSGKSITASIPVYSTVHEIASSLICGQIAGTLGGHAIRVLNIFAPINPISAGLALGVGGALVCTSLNTLIDEKWEIGKLVHPHLATALKIGVLALAFTAFTYVYTKVAVLSFTANVCLSLGLLAISSLSWLFSNKAIAYKKYTHTEVETTNLNSGRKNRHEYNSEVEESNT